MHPGDRRIVRVRLTAGGERTLQQNRSVRTAFVASRLKRLSGDERARLGELVGLLETSGGREVTRFRRVADTTFKSMRTRNYRLWFTGQIISVSGTWMQSVAQAWLVLRLAPRADQGIDLGLTTALQFLPMLLFGAWGGLIADRFDKRRLLFATQASAGVLACRSAILTATGTVRLWQVFLLALLLGVVNLFDNPTRQSFVVEMVG